jgi:hypothetical protein
MIHFKFESNGIPHMQRSHGESILLQNDKGDEVQIKSKNIFQPRKSLGHLKSPAGGAIVQAMAIKDTVISLTEAIDRCG